jgi:hypothetical protein
VTGNEGDVDSGTTPRLRLVSGDAVDTGGADDGSGLGGELVDADDTDTDTIDLGDLGDLGGDQVIGLDLNPEAGPDLDFLLVPLLTEAELQMRSIRRPLDAEMWASELLGMLELGAPDDSTAEEREAVTLNLATRMADYALDQDSPTGLAILRTLSVIGPAASRQLAREDAQEMVENGFRDRAWMPALGRPDVGRCWRFRDAEGRQESVTVVFGYGKREHTLTVLIDHDLGGGVRDCWVGEDPDAVLGEARAALEPEGIEVEFIPAEQATSALNSALTRPECPGSAEEIEDIAMTRALLQARVEWLAGAANE